MSQLTILLIMQISLQHQVMESILHPKYLSNSTLSTYFTDSAIVQATIVSTHINCNIIPMDQLDISFSTPIHLLLFSQDKRE